MPTRKPIPGPVFLILIALAVSAPRAAESPAATDAASAPDSALAALKDPLLPEIMSPGEKLLWGEHGWMRSLARLPLNEESREKEMGIRRAMLTMHQIGGFTTLAAMIATAYCGQMIINGHEGYKEPKETLAGVTVTLYFATASLALLSPPPAIRRPGFSSISLHKALAWGHFTGMIITPLLGTMIEDNRKLRVFHQVSGYATTALFAGAMITVTLF
jgi:hypothetical protein